MSRKKDLRASKGVKPAGRSKVPEAVTTGRQSDVLVADLRTMIDSARERAAAAVNSELIMLYWGIGERIRREILRGRRAEYGKQIVSMVSERLSAAYNRGFTEKNIRRMLQFAEVFPKTEIVAALPRQLSWSHLIEIIPLKEPLLRDFYIEMCRIEKWSTRTLRSKIRGMLYERTAISRKPDALAQEELAAFRDEDRMSPDLVFRDSYILDFIGLADSFSEKDFEQAIIVELQRFILELGSDFSFIARQKRMTIGREDFYLDLLFFHRRLNCLVAVELKLGRFSAAFKGQMELYLRWLEKHERRGHEESPVGLIFCSGKDHEQVELLQLGEGEIRVAEYLTELPPREVLQNRLSAARRRAMEIIGDDKE